MSIINQYCIIQLGKQKLNSVTMVTVFYLTTHLGVSHFGKDYLHHFWPKQYSFPVLKRKVLICNANKSREKLIPF